MALDATSLYAVANELNNLLSGGRIEKVSQGEKYQITLLIRANRNNYRLLLSASSSYARMHIVSEATMNPEKPPMFCMLLRKRLIAGRITSIKQIDMERIIKIKIAARNELGQESVYYLYCEMMGRHSNIILVDDNNIIVESAKRVDENKSRVRQVMPTLEYIPPPPQDKVNPKSLSADDFYRLFLANIESPIINTLQSKISGLSKKTLIYLVQDIADIDAPFSRLSDEQLVALSEEIYNFYNVLFSNNIKYYAIYDDANTMIDFTLLVNAPSIHHKKYESINQLIDDFYKMRALRDNIARRVSSLRQSVKTQLDRSVRKLAKQQNILTDEKSLDKYKLYGELITSFAYLVPKGASEIDLQNFYSEKEDTITVPLDPRKSASSNAARFFKKYKKLKTAISLAHNQIKKTTNEVNYLESTLHLIDQCDSEDLAIEIQTELKQGGYIKKSSKKTSRKLPASKPHHFLSSDNHDIYVGRNNKQNDELTMRFARGDDIWLHTKDIPGSHVIIRQKNNAVSDSAIKDGAFLATWFSKARNSSHVPVDYTKKRNVRKPNGAKPGYVIYLTNATTHVTCTKEAFAQFKDITE
ncbi:MAG: NFACT family protein [Clostridiales bacterium]|nr:NFACT family protein [Clostridiales bacterium]